VEGIYLSIPAKMDENEVEENGDDNGEDNREESYAK
jgi:hypothetical protein